MPQTKPTANEQQLMTKALTFKYDPLGFVLWAFPWGKTGTPLEHFPHPRKWQLEELKKLSDELKKQQVEIRQQVREHTELIPVALSSGRGTGKSALLSMLDIWAMSCWWGGTTIVTANTEPQLRSRTLSELGKWLGLSITAHWFDKQGITMRPQPWFAQMLQEQMKIDADYYYVQGQTWSEENPDGFAGAHSQTFMMVQYDEASGIPKPIWDVTEGFFTDIFAVRIHLVISNPRRVDTPFFECFNKYRDQWRWRYINAMEVEGVDRGIYQRIIDKYGIDSDEARVEVFGKFPRSGDNQFIAPGLVNDAMRGDQVDDLGAALLMGVDVARFGDDKSIVGWKQGRNARVLPWEEFKGLDTMELADVVAGRIQRHRPDAVFVDEGGIGAGVVDRLRQMGYRSIVFGVQSGRVKNLPDNMENNRIRLWSLMKEWLEEGGRLPENEELYSDLISPIYLVKEPAGKIMLEPVKDMKKRGLPSPDWASALAMMFDRPVARRDMIARRRPGISPRVKTDFEDMWS